MSQESVNIDPLLRFVTEELSSIGSLRVQALTPPGLITQEGLNAYLSEKEVQPQCVLQSELDLLLSEVVNDPSQPHERVVARGRSPDHGLDATIELTQEFDKRFARIAKRNKVLMIARNETSLDRDKGTAVDFYNESCFVIAFEGEHIANHIQHTTGTDGIDIYGKTIVAQDGKPLANPIDNSCQIEEGGKIIAMLDGLVEAHPEHISINPTLNIPGSVDFSTGHVVFPGSIIIENGVRDRFRVDSNCDIEIHKLAEAAHLRAKNNIKLHQGMAGRESGTINALGELHSGYLDAVEAVVMGDCIIEREVTNCKMQVFGRIEAKSATIRGGLIEAACGGVVGVLGSASGVRTDVILASHPTLQKKISTILQFQPKLANKIVRAEQQAAELRTSIGKPSTELEAEAQHLDSIVENLKDKQDKLERGMQRLLDLLEQHTQCELTVISRIHPKTHLWLPGMYAAFEKEVKGEFTIRLDREGKPVLDWGNRTDPLDQYAKVYSDQRVPARCQSNSKAA